MNTKEQYIPILLCILLTGMQCFVFGNVWQSATPSGFAITVKIEGKQYDSLAILSFSYAKQYQPLLTSPFASEVVFKGKEALPSGFYLLTGDQEALTYLIISDDQSQHFKIIAKNDEFIFEGSHENTANQEYMAKMRKIDEELSQLDQESKRRRQQTNLSKTEIESFIDSLLQRLDELNRQRFDIQQDVAKKNKGSLLASLVKASIEMENPPREYFSDKNKMENHYVTHFFEYFPWDDSRILETPIAYNRFVNFARLLTMFSQESANAFITKVFTEMQPYPNAYYFVFDFLEKTIGTQASNTFMEQTYITMLKNALAYNKLEEARKLRYNAALKRLDKNHQGMEAPDFKILLSTGDTTSLHGISADYMLLILQNPDCPTCKELREKLEKIDLLKKAIAEQKVKVLTVYFEKNEALWRNYLKKANPNYINGWNYDISIENNVLYDTHIIPFMFLLDRDKKILAKDIFWTEIESKFIELGIK